MAFLERLGAFAGKRLAEEGIALRQRHHAEHDLDLTAAIDGLCLPEVELRFTGRVRQRHEDFRRRLLVTPDLVADDRDSTRVAVFLAEPIEDPPARVTLLRVFLLVVFQDRVNDREKRPDRRLAALDLLPVAGRLRMAHDLLDRPEIQIVLLARLPPAEAIDEHITPDVGPLIHVGNHSFPSRS